LLPRQPVWATPDRKIIHLNIIIYRITHLIRFLYQMDHLGQENYVPNPVLEKALDVLFLIHADHELNASATTVLQTGSSLVDPYSAIA
jgi:citrate synthase